jgi:hypothetical protein
MKRAPIISMSDSILFEDVLSRTFKLQYEHFRHWNVSNNLGTFSRSVLMDNYRLRLFSFASSEVFLEKEKS